MIDILARLAGAARRSSLQVGAHPLTVRDAGSLRVLEQLEEESQLGPGAGFIRLYREMLERDGHAMTVRGSESF
jgi:hypothetical protein